MIGQWLDARHLRRIHDTARGWATGRALLVHLAARHCDWRAELYDGQRIDCRAVRLVVRPRRLSMREARTLLRSAKIRR